MWCATARHSSLSCDVCRQWQRRPPAGIGGVAACAARRVPQKSRAASRPTRLAGDKLLILLAGGRGFEPRVTESESAVLPLNYPPPGSAKQDCAERREKPTCAPDGDSYVSGCVGGGKPTAWA